jgi:hypothetical protein
MLILAALFLVGVVWELCAARSAPFGYQDETGFHIGIQRTNDDSRRQRTSRS